MEGVIARIVLWGKPFVGSGRPTCRALPGSLDYRGRFLWKS
ncbi:conserved hypothetical protein [Burkholderia pseudomallei MSHR346]|nr:hypothetical protein BURPS668_A1902 [Burkholderia pseudomallei 668]EEP51976.1 conserved hypothetical protein [Burkholderia pseudomallei MSHR346]